MSTPKEEETPEHLQLRVLLSKAERERMDAGSAFDKATAYERGIRDALHELEKVQQIKKP